jgi:hypothetical protein
VVDLCCCAAMRGLPTCIICLFALLYSALLACLPTYLPACLSGWIRVLEAHTNSWSLVFLLADAAVGAYSLSAGSDCVHARGTGNSRERAGA